MPLAAIGAREEVPPCCVTVISANACCQVASCRLCETFGQATDRCSWTQRTPPIWSHSPQCTECDHVGGRVWVGRVRRRRWTKDCGIERGRFRRMPDGDHRTRGVKRAFCWLGKARPRTRACLAVDETDESSAAPTHDVLYKFPVSLLHERRSDVKIGIYLKYDPTALCDGTIVLRCSRLPRPPPLLCALAIR